MRTPTDIQNIVDEDITTYGQRYVDEIDDEIESQRLAGNEYPITITIGRYNEVKPYEQFILKTVTDAGWDIILQQEDRETGGTGYNGHTEVWSTAVIHPE